jgi:hypothetical protein
MAKSRRNAHFTSGGLDESLAEAIAEQHPESNGHEMSAEEVSTRIHQRTAALTPQEQARMVGEFLPAIAAALPMIRRAVPMIRRALPLARTAAAALTGRRAPSAGPRPAPAAAQPAPLAAQPPPAAPPPLPGGPGAPAAAAPMLLLVINDPAVQASLLSALVGQGATRGVSLPVGPRGLTPLPTGATLNLIGQLAGNAADQLMTGDLSPSEAESDEGALEQILGQMRQASGWRPPAAAEDVSPEDWETW